MLTAPIEYEQTDSRWKNVMYSSHKDKTQTIGTSGCGPACAAMVAATLISPKITPLEAAEWAMQRGYRTYEDGTAWGFFCAYLHSKGIGCRQTQKTEEAVKALQEGLMVITAAGKGLWTSGGHFILAYGLSEDGTKVLIHDPNSESPKRELADIKKYREQTVQYWIVTDEWRKEDEEEVEIKDISVKNLDTGKTITVSGFNHKGFNYVAMRDLIKIFPVDVAYEKDENGNVTPTFRLNYKE